MKFRSIVIWAFGVLTMLLFAGTAAPAQAQVRTRAEANSATHVAAEMTKGKLNPGQSKPGDQVTMRLKDDLKSNGRVLLKKGTAITGVVRNVRTVETKSQNSADAQSMVQIDWLVPAAQGTTAQQLSISLQSVSQYSPLYGAEETGGDNFGHVDTSSSGTGSGGLLGGAVSTVGTIGSGVASNVGGVGSVASSAGSRASGQSNAALLSMPSVVAADHQTAAALEGTLGTTASGRLFKVGHGELISANGSRQSLDIFSHLSNDTVITSHSNNFEISSGAQMQFLVGVSKQ